MSKGVLSILYLGQLLYIQIKEYQKGADNTESWVSLGRFCGSQTPSALKSTTNRVRVKFRSDASNSGNGFSLNYTAGNDFYCLTDID